MDATAKCNELNTFALLSAKKKPYSDRRSQKSVLCELAPLRSCMRYAGTLMQLKAAAAMAHSGKHAHSSNGFACAKKPLPHRQLQQPQQQGPASLRTEDHESKARWHAKCWDGKKLTAIYELMGNGCFKDESTDWRKVWTFSDPRKQLCPERRTQTCRKTHRQDYPRW